MKKVLHVTACFNGGVGRIINNIAQNEVGLNHYLLFDSHADSPSEDTDSFEGRIFHWNENLIKKLPELLKVYRLLNPDIIHLHSTVAGILGRLLPLKAEIYFSPHCFSFQRKDINFLFRFFLILLEIILSTQNSRSIAHWPIEDQIFKKITKKENIYHYPSIQVQKNRGDLFGEQEKNLSLPLKVAAVGRIRPQKDPKFFCKVAEETSKRHLPVEFYWIGDGDFNLKTNLIEKNVKVINWVQSKAIHNIYPQFDVILITSLWESGPLTLFEALDCGKPVILRKNKAHQMYGVKTFKDIDSIVNYIQVLAENRDMLETEWRHQILQISQIEFFQKKQNPYG
jgi:glycosyltransferase involved in cell wall biosynthesis